MMAMVDRHKWCRRCGADRRRKIYVKRPKLFTEDMTFRSVALNHSFSRTFIYTTPCGRMRHHWYSGVYRFEMHYKMRSLEKNPYRVIYNIRRIRNNA